MTGIVIVFVLIGAASAMRALFGQRRIRPAFIAEDATDRSARSIAQRQSLPLQWESVEEDDADIAEEAPVDPIFSATPPVTGGRNRSAAHLLDAHPPGKGPDKTAALIDMMTGPGLCTPHTG